MLSSPRDLGICFSNVLFHVKNYFVTTELNAIMESESKHHQERFCWDAFFAITLYQFSLDLILEIFHYNPNSNAPIFCILLAFILHSSAHIINRIFAVQAKDCTGLMQVPVKHIWALVGAFMLAHGNALAQSETAFSLCSALLRTSILSKLNWRGRLRR